MRRAAASAHRSLDDVPHNLPTHLDSFFGQQGEMAEVVRLLEANRLVTLTGGPGVGPSSLPATLHRAVRCDHMIDVSPERFAELVAEALDGIPPELRGMMENVAVVVDDDSPPGRILGLYDGIPLTERGEYGGLALPDKITIFRQAVCAYCDSSEELVAQVRQTVVHEVAHHFGIDDERLDELGWG